MTASIAVFASSVGSNDYHYYLSEQNQVLKEQLQVGAGTPTVRNEFVWHPQYVDALAARLDMTGGGDGVYYHTLHDANFNTTAIINGTATVQERYHYTPYGQTTFLDSSFANPSATSTKNQENLYTSQQLDPETGLFYYRIEPRRRW